MHSLFEVMFNTDAHMPSSGKILH